MTRQPIDGIWCNCTLTAVRSGCFAYGNVIPSNHQAIWIGLSFEDGMFIAKDAWKGILEDHQGDQIQQPLRPPSLAALE
jgi:hypothetical protein